MCVTSLLCGPRADLWPFLCKLFSLYMFYILNDLFSRRIFFFSCVVQELSHILNLGPVFPVFPF